MARSLFILALAAIYAAQSSAAPASSGGDSEAGASHPDDSFNAGASDGSKGASVAATAPIASASAHGKDDGGKDKKIPEECVKLYVKNNMHKSGGFSIPHPLIPPIPIIPINGGHGPQIISSNSKSSDAGMSTLAVSGTGAAGPDPTSLAGAAGGDASLGARHPTSSINKSNKEPTETGASSESGSGKPKPPASGALQIPPQCEDWMKDIEKIAKEIKDALHVDHKSEKSDAHDPKGGASSTEGGHQPTGIPSGDGAKPSDKTASALRSARDLD